MESENQRLKKKLDRYAFRSERPITVEDESDDEDEGSDENDDHESNDENEPPNKRRSLNSTLDA